jgi:hypothetical protein
LDLPLADGGVVADLLAVHGDTPFEARLQEEVGEFEMGSSKRFYKVGKIKTCSSETIESWFLSRALEEKASLNYFKQNRRECTSSR